MDLVNSYVLTVSFSSSTVPFLIIKLRDYGTYKWR
jgi:hypothetical protein